MPGSLITEFGRCGFGGAGGLFPELRLGLIRVWWCRGSVSDKFRSYDAALIAAKEMNHLLLTRFKALVAKIGERS